MSKKKTNQPAPIATAPASPPPAPPAQTPFFQKKWLPALAFAALAILLYVNTLGHDYCLDDFGVIAKNELVKKGFAGIPELFSTEYRQGHAEHKIPGQTYRPLSLAVLAIEWQLAPNAPGFYHFINVLLYALLGAALWLVWRRVLSRHSLLLPATAVAVFLAHPIHTEVVANIKSVDEILGLLLPTLALGWLWRHWQGGGFGSLAAALLVFTAGLFSKESAVTFLGIFPLAGYFFSEKKLPDVLRTCAWFLLPTAIFLLVRQSALSGQVADTQIFELDNVIAGASNLGERLGTTCLFFGLYLRSLFVPHPLWSDLSARAVEPVSLGDWRAILGLLAALGLLVWAVWRARERSVLAFAVLFFFISFSLVSNLFFLVGTSYGERLAFAPSFGFALAVGWLFTTYFSENQKLTTPGWAALALLLGLCAVKTIARNPDWKNDLTLLEADLPKAPNSARLNYHYGLQLAKKARPEGSNASDPALLRRAVEHCTRALELYPNYWNVRQVRGLAYDELGENDKALADYLEFLKKDPSNTKIQLRSFRLFYQKNDLARAETALRECLKYGLKTFDVYFNLGVTLALSGRKPEAIEAFKSALKIDPKNAEAQGYLQRLQAEVAPPDESGG